MMDILTLGYSMTYQISTNKIMICRKREAFDCIDLQWHNPKGRDEEEKKDLEGDGHCLT
jgi:hypothetical protein